MVINVSIQPLLIETASPVYHTGIKKLLNDRKKDLKPFYANTLAQIIKILKAESPLPVVLTDAFVMEERISCISFIKNAVPGTKIIVHAEHFAPDLHRYIL